MKKYRIGIMGAGAIARTMATTIAGMQQAECYAIASRTLEKAETFAKEYDFQRAYGSYEELVKDEAVDLIYVATPHSEHFDNAMLCVRHHKPVLVEKSFTANVKQARELLSFAEKEKVLVTEAIWVRYMPFLYKIKEVMDSGIIGEPKLLTANLGYNIIRKQRLIQPELAGGALLDVGIYALSFAYMIFGNEIEKTSSGCTYWHEGKETADMPEQGSFVDAQDSMTLFYSDGKMAVLNASMLSVSDRKGIIHGEKGFIVIENINNFESMTVYDAGYHKIAYYEREKQLTGYEYEVEAALQALEAGQLECWQMPHSETLSVMGLMDSFRETWGIQYPFEVRI